MLGCDCLHCNVLSVLAAVFGVWSLIYLVYGAVCNLGPRHRTRGKAKPRPVMVDAATSTTDPGSSLLFGCGCAKHGSGSGVSANTPGDSTRPSTCSSDINVVRDDDASASASAFARDRENDGPSHESGLVLRDPVPSTATKITPTPTPTPTTKACSIAASPKSSSTFVPTGAVNAGLCLQAFLSNARLSLQHGPDLLLGRLRFLTTADPVFRRATPLVSQALTASFPRQSPFDPSSVSRDSTALLTSNGLHLSSSACMPPHQSLHQTLRRLGMPESSTAAVVAAATNLGAAAVASRDKFLTLLDPSGWSVHARRFPDDGHDVAGSLVSSTKHPSFSAISVKKAHEPHCSSANSSSSSTSTSTLTSSSLHLPHSSSASSVAPAGRLAANGLPAPELLAMFTDAADSPLEAVGEESMILSHIFKDGLLPFSQTDTPVAYRDADVTHAVNTYNPKALHVSSHATVHALVAGVKDADVRLDLVFLNTCSSENTAFDLIRSGRTNYVVAWRSSVNDVAAALFSKAFYEGLRAFDWNVPRAYSRALDVLTRSHFYITKDPSLSPSDARLAGVPVLISGEFAGNADSPNERDVIAFEIEDPNSRTVVRISSNHRRHCGAANPSPSPLPPNTSAPLPLAYVNTDVNTEVNTDRFPRPSFSIETAFSSRNAVLRSLPSLNEEGSEDVSLPKADIDAVETVETVEAVEAEGADSSSVSTIAPAADPASNAAPRSVDAVWLKVETASGRFRMIRNASIGGNFDRLVDIVGTLTAPAFEYIGQDGEVYDVCDSDGLAAAIQTQLSSGSSNLPRASPPGSGRQIVTLRLAPAPAPASDSTPAETTRPGSDSPASEPGVPSHPVVVDGGVAETIDRTILGPDARHSEAGLSGSPEPACTSSGPPGTSPDENAREPVILPSTRPPSADPTVRPANKPLEASKAVVSLDVVSLDPSSKSLQLARSGSGTILTRDGMGITNYHVVAPLLASGGKRLSEGGCIGVLGRAFDWKDEVSWLHTFEVIEVDKDLDVALFRVAEPVQVTASGWRGSIAREVTLRPRRLKGAAPTFPVAALGDSTSLAPMDRLIAVGYPALGGRTLTFSSTEHGGLSPPRRPGQCAHIKFTGSLNSGGSGGALFDAQGKLVGIPSHSPRLGTPSPVRFIRDGKWETSYADFDPCVEPLNHAIPISDVLQRFSSRLSAVAAE